MHTYSFEKLGVWQDARELVKYIYSLTSALPIEEKFGIVSQIRRAAVSISCNLAEGSGRKSKKDQAQFYRIAFGSSL
ncbi:MAG TPA: four helix bundle protein [Chitinophagaceae bacterium]|nr:four helix bundle protein [Chitinophagaceae bacterium]